MVNRFMSIVISGINKSFPKNLAAPDGISNRLPGFLRRWKWSRGGSRVDRLVALIICLGLTTVLCARATTYYAAPDGSSGNSGLSTNSPWTLAYALSHAGPNNTIVLMDGNYPDVGGYQVTSSAQVIRALNKWRAVLPNSTYHGIYSTADYVTLDGLKVSDAAVDGIKVNANHCTVQNCWVVHCAQQGISSHNPYNSNLFQSNLTESNGWSTAMSLSHWHGFYIGGQNSIIRNNVARHNSGWGIQLYPEDNYVLYNCQVYNNLVYNNNTGYPDNGGGIVVYSNTATNVMVTNYFFGNTIYEPYAQQGCIDGKYGIMCITNNILAGPLPIFSWGGNVYRADYNLTTVSASTTGSHDVIAALPGFVNSGNGLYWLATTSQARGKALSTVFGPMDFFGNARSSIGDIGAFQYSTGFTNDIRNLDPSPVVPDYWEATLPPTNLHVESVVYN